MQRKKLSERGRMGEYIVVTEPEDQIYGVLFYRRRPFSDNTPVPFGYI
jgi:hypothetical protein